ncbi:hypothetical protein ACHAWX_001303 [Stephanocyclus meneghinianus]
MLPSFFGLGPAELVLITIAGVFMLGPSKLAQMSQEVENLAANSSRLGEEWKKIPEEFKKGIEEGEIEAESAGPRPWMTWGRTGDGHPDCHECSAESRPDHCHSKEDCTALSCCWNLIAKFPLTLKVKTQ